MKVEGEKLNPAVSIEKPMIDVEGEPTTALWTLTGEVDTAAAASEDSTALLNWLISEFKAPAGDVAAMRAVMTLEPLDSELPIVTRAVNDGTEPASPPTTAEPRDSSALELRLEVEPDSRLIFPPKGDRETNVGVEPSFPEEVAEFVELPNRTLTFDAMLAVKGGTPISAVVCRLATEVDKAPKPVDTAVTLLPIMVMDDSDP